MRQAEELASAMNITAVPTMLVNRKYLIPGAQDPGTYVQLLRQVVDIYKLDLEDGATADDLLHAADVAMYAAKFAGGGRTSSANGATPEGLQRGHRGRPDGRRAASVNPE